MQALRAIGAEPVFLHKASTRYDVYYVKSCLQWSEPVRPLPPLGRALTASSLDHTSPPLSKRRVCGNAMMPIKRRHGWILPFTCLDSTPGRIPIPETGHRNEGAPVNSVFLMQAGMSHGNARQNQNTEHENEQAVGVSIISCLHCRINSRGHGFAFGNRSMALLWVMGAIRTGAGG
ncbi:hypothetical protein D3C78_1198420 [compost metagenome]